MAIGIETAFTGNLGDKPNLRYSGQGKPWATFSVAVSEKKFNSEERETTWVPCKLFGQAAENAAASLEKGTNVIVTGRFRMEKWQPEGEQERQRMVLIVDNIGPSLRFAEAKVTRTPSEGGYGGNGGGYSNRSQGNSNQGGNDDPWGGGNGGGYSSGANPFGDDADPFG